MTIYNLPSILSDLSCSYTTEHFVAGELILGDYVGSRDAVGTLESVGSLDIAGTLDAAGTTCVNPLLAMATG